MGKVTGPGLLDLASWHGTIEPPHPVRLRVFLEQYVSAGGTPDALAPRGGLTAENWALGWHRMWAMWDLPVGKSEPGEPITETAVRELYEETGLTVKPESLKVAHIIHGAWGVEAPNGFLTVVFVTHEWAGEPENREPRKHSQVRWIDANAVPGNFVDTTSSALHQYLAGGPEVSLDGWK
ncbi:hypothetical protein Spla01_06336 [Streptomyces platensis]|uniref:Nudix hydrolase domain-containing protein n=1 Tax=Streptomyces platensis TaxID=58346 RepID=A0ABX3Y4M0_STRPT|nr:NUDIX domain-containing protein [Streptomyces platensis]OSY47601.1 hypothetical protein BG653_00856 [Streptomyces platensis]